MRIKYGVDVRLTEAHLREIHFQGTLVEMAFEDINRCFAAGDYNGPRLWYSLSGALNSMASISNILWPTRNRADVKMRSAAIRKTLGVDDSGLTALRDVRNKLVHFDEYMDKWNATSRRGMLVDRFVGPADTFPSISPEDFARRYDVYAQELSVFGSAIGLVSALNEVQNLMADIEACRNYFGDSLVPESEKSGA